MLSSDNGLYGFQPASLTFTKIGTLDCPSAGATPRSMAIDRSGTAWVNFTSGALFKVSTADASCQATPFQSGQSDFVKFGMGFSSNSAGAAEETLYVVGASFGRRGKGLATIDLSTFELTPIGDFSGPLAGIGAELTGTSDAKLYGFFETSPAALAEIEKANASTPAPRPLDGLTTGTAWAFSAWGGDFWFYTSNGHGSSKVTRLKAATDDSLVTVV